MKVALVYDRVNKFGGAERVLQALHQVWPKAPLFTAVHNQKTASWAKDFKVHTSFLQNFPLAKTHHELYPWLTPIAFESFNFSQFDIVISVTSAEAKSIITSPKTLHVCYCLTPTRYLWSHQNQYLDSPGLGAFSWLGKTVFKKTQPYLQQLDLITSNRPDHYLAISKEVQERIKQYYQRSSQIIHPPVDTQKFSHQKAKDYFLLVSRLVPYKKVDLAIRTFNQLGQKLIIVGTGRQEKSLKKLAGPTIQFTDQSTETRLVNLYQHCQALIMPQKEDFGIVSLEAQASGKPVIAFKSGGALDTIIEDETGIFFTKPTVDSLTQAVKRFTLRKWDANKIQSHAKKFDLKIFKASIKKAMEDKWLKHNQ